MASLRLTIINSSLAEPGMETTKVFDESGGTIGRGWDNDWVLADSNRYISSRHAIIYFKNREFVIEDTSTNGVFINNSKEKLGKNNTHSLRGVRSVKIGAFLLSVNSDAVDGETVTSISPLENEDQTLLMTKASASTASAKPNPSSETVNPEIKSTIPEDWEETGFTFKSNQPVVANKQDAGSDKAKPNVLKPSAEKESSDGFSDGSKIGFVGVIQRLAEKDSKKAAESKQLAKSTEKPVDDFPRKSGDRPADSVSEVAVNNPAEKVMEKTEDSLSETLFGSTFGNLFENHSGKSAQKVADKPASKTSDPLVPKSPDQPAPKTPRQLAEKPSDKFTTAPPNAALNENDLPQSESQRAFAGSAMAEKIANMMCGPINSSVNSAVNSSGEAPGGSSRAAVKPPIALVQESFAQAEFDPKVLTDKKVVDQWMSLLPIVLEGMLDLLKARESIKNELRLDKTLLGAAENNPLKYSTNVQDAVVNLFLHPRPGFKDAAGAMLEAFSDLKRHQNALLFGFQASYLGLIDHLNPANIESRALQRPGSKNVFGKMSDSVKWQEYLAMHRSLEEGIIRHLSGNYAAEFVKAYESYILECEDS